MINKYLFSKLFCLTFPLVPFSYILTNYFHDNIKNYFDILYTVPQQKPYGDDI